MTDIVRATPTDERITHDLVLSDGITNLGLILCNSRGIPVRGGAPWSIKQSGATRTSLQIRTGDADYSDYQLPYTPFTQKDWSGGRGNEDFEKDTSRFFDSNRMDTRMGDILLGPKDTPVDLEGSTTYIEPIPDDTSINNELTGSYRVASMYTPSVAARVSSIAVRVSPGSTTKVEIILDVGGSPSTLPTDIIASAEYSVPDLVTSDALSGAALGESQIGINDLGHGVNVANPLETVIVDIPISASLTTGNSYWITVTTDSFGYGPLTGSLVLKETVTPGTWATLYTDYALYFKITSYVQGMVIFFEYKGGLYAVVKEDAGSASRLYLNGYRFTAQTGSTQTKIKIPSGTGITSAELIGCTLVVIGGKCYDEDPNYKEITSNTTTEINLSSAFKNTPDTTTDVVILGANTWKEITGTGFAKAVTSVCVANGFVYFAQGEDTNIRKMREYNNSGTWTRSFADDGTNKASFLMLLPAHTGKMKIWKFNNPTSGNPTAAYSEPKAWATALDFTTKPTELAAETDYPINIGDAQSKITNVVGYGDPMIPYVIKEDEFGSIASGVYASVPISELRQVKSEINGKAVIQYGVYLFISVLEGLERYYENRLDDVGPNRDEGMPSGRKGNVSSIVSYPGGLYMSVDATASGYSSVLYWNQFGYHEVYRANQGQRIRSLHIQTIPGGKSGRLWVGLASKTVWLPVCMNPRQQEDYRYTSTGSLESSWFNGGFKEINKFWQSLQVYAENLSAGQTISAEYMTDQDNTWHALPDTFDTSPMQEVLMSSDYTVYGKRWKYRLTLTTNDDTKSPRVKAVTVPSVTRLPPNKAWSMTVLADDAMVDHQGDRQTLSAKDVMDQLETWADSMQTPIPLVMRSPVSAFDNKRVFIEPPTIQPVEVENGKVKKLKAIITLSVYAA